MPNSLFTVRRQDLLFLRPDFQPLAGPECDAGDASVVREWAALGRPVIVRRPGFSDDGRGVHCGVPLPSARGKKRIAFVAPLESVGHAASLPRLCDCVPVAESRGVEGLARLSDLFAGNGFDPLVFGSLAWERLTGERYFGGGSDVDLRFDVGGEDELRRLFSMLGGISQWLPRCDVEITQWNDCSFSWREFAGGSRKIMVKTTSEVFLVEKSALLPGAPKDEAALAEKMSLEAVSALREELDTYPKPGLVSPRDSGSHRDMDASHFRKSISALRGYFRDISLAGMRGAGMDELRPLGLAAENAMHEATGGVNTHRGAIFTLGLLTAAAGRKLAGGIRETPGEIVRSLWGSDIMNPANEDPRSHGSLVRRRHGVWGARKEASEGFPSVWRTGLPVFRDMSGRHDRNTARLCSFFAMLGEVDDTTILYRGGDDGLAFARKSAGAVANSGEPGSKSWSVAAEDAHREFVGRGLSPGGVADLLSAVVFAHRMEELCRDLP